MSISSILREGPFLDELRALLGGETKKEAETSKSETDSPREPVWEGDPTTKPRTTPSTDGVVPVVKDEIEVKAGIEPFRVNNSEGRFVYTQIGYVVDCVGSFSANVAAGVNTFRIPLPVTRLTLSADCHGVAISNIQGFVGHGVVKASDGYSDAVLEFSSTMNTPCTITVSMKYAVL